MAGGEDILGWNLVRQLGRFHEVWVLTDSKNRPGIEASFRGEALPSVRFCYVELPRWLGPLERFQGGVQFYAYLWQVAAYFVARALHQQFNFNVFHHVTYANDWMASFIGALLPIPYIRGPGGGANQTPPGFFGEYAFRDRVWERFRSIGQRLLRWDPFFIQGQSRALAILVCNRESLDVLPRRWRDTARIFPVNGISSRDLDLLDSMPSTDHGFRVFSAGKVIHWKGFGLAVKSFAAFAAKCPEAQFMIAGDGRELPRLKALVGRLGLETKVFFEEWLQRDEVLFRMRSCDVFLYASLRDGGGAVVVEALAAGKPVVCMDLAGPGVHVEEDCGIKIIPQSPKQAATEMAFALEFLYKNSESRLRMGKAARERAERVYHWDRLGDRLLEIYREVLGTLPVGVET